MSKWICKTNVGGFYLELDTENLPDSLGDFWRDLYDNWGYDYDFDDKLLSVIDMGDYFECYYNGRKLHEVDNHMTSFLVKYLEFKGGRYDYYE